MRIDEAYDSLYAALRVISTKLDALTALVHQSLTKETKMAVDLSELKAQVTRVQDLDQAAKMLLEGLAAKIDDLASKDTVDPAELAALAASLRDNSDDLAAAVSANTR